MPENRTYSGHTDRQDRVERKLAKLREGRRSGKAPLVSEPKRLAYALWFASGAEQARSEGNDCFKGARWTDFCLELHHSIHETAFQCCDQLNREFGSCAVRPEENLYFDVVDLVEGRYVNPSGERSKAGRHICFELRRSRHAS